jgi:hypothetical protein
VHLPAFTQTPEMRDFRERRRAEAAWHSARPAERQKLHADCHQRKRGVVRRMAALLEQVATESRALGDLEDTERAA